MKYVQKNPVPIPATGAFAEVRATLDAVFDWEYALKQQNLLALYEKGKAQNWNASDLDWSTDVDMARIMRERVGGAGELMNQLLNPPRPLSADENIDVPDPHERLHALAVPARRAGRAARDREDRRDRAVGGGQVLRREPGARRGATRRGVPPLPHREARRLLRRAPEPAGAARRHPARPALGPHLPRHADPGRGPRARGLRPAAAPDDGRAADPGHHRAHHGRRVAPRGLRRDRARERLHEGDGARASCASARTS